MKLYNLLLCLVFLGGQLLFTGAFRIICEFKDLAAYKTGDGRLVPENINPKLCTHIQYDFFTVSSDFKITTAYPNEQDIMQRIGLLRAQNPSLKIIASIGGWDQASELYSVIARNDYIRRIFSQSVLEFLLRYNFDGLNIAWSYPASRGGVPGDKDAFVVWLQELRFSFARYNLILSISAPASRAAIDAGYDVPKIASIVDYINLLTFDLKGAWNNIAGHSSQLYPTSSDTNSLREMNQDWVVNYWVAFGAPIEKLILGIPFYGRTFTLSNPLLISPDAPTSGPGTPGPITQEQYILSYPEICQKLKSGWKNGFLEYPQQSTPYAYGPNYYNGVIEWVGYENQNSVNQKTLYALSRKMGGVAVWALDLDDFTGKYCGQGQYPLLTSINTIVSNIINPVTATTLAPITIPPTTTTTTTATTTVAAVTTNAPFCLMEYGADYPGNDISIVGEANLEDCCIKCSQTPNCKSWTYLATYKLCFLKSVDLTIQNRREIKEAVSGQLKTTTFVCPSVGAFANVANGCKDYYICLQNPTSGILESRLISCNPGFLYDKKNGFCNYEMFVQCV